MLQSKLRIAFRALTTCFICLLTAITATADDGTPISIGNSFTIQSEILGQEREINVRLPSYFDKKREYPVLYLIDGGVEQDFPHIAGLAQHADISWSIEPFILVGIKTDKRTYEITTQYDNPKVMKVMKKVGGADDFRRFIAEEVIPWTEENYKVSSRTAIMGESLAGLFVVDTFLHQPDMVQDYIAISPSLWWNDLKFIKEGVTQLANHDDAKRRLYLTIADEGFAMQDGMDLFVEALTNNAPAGLEWIYIDRTKSEHHGSIYHNAALDALRTMSKMAVRTGTEDKYFYLFGDTKPEPYSDMAKKSLKKRCTEDVAIDTSFAEVSADLPKWRGVCVKRKLGQQTYDAGTGIK